MGNIRPVMRGKAENGGINIVFIHLEALYRLGFR